MTIPSLDTVCKHRLLAMALGCALLAGCATAPIGSAPVVSPELPAAGVPPGGGGYYQDDGPHAVPPVDLDKVPDAVPRVETLHRYANRPYSVMGQDFRPAAQLAPFRQRGKASWYGRKFHGKRTASGEIYDMYKMTAAHPTLPIPSYVRVRHLDNGRSVVVRINDRGPFLRGRVIDLSYAAAHKLDYIRAGSAPVEVEAIVPEELAMMDSQRPVPALRRPGAAAAVQVPLAEPEPLVEPAAVAPAMALEVRELTALPAVPLPAPASAAAPEPAQRAAAGAEAAPADPLPAAPVEPATGQAFIQLGAFMSHANAEDFLDLVVNDLKQPRERLRIVPEGLRFRLHLGPYVTVEEARREAARLGAALRTKPFVVMR